MGTCRKICVSLLAAMGHAGLELARVRACLWNPFVSLYSRCLLWGTVLSGWGN